MHTVDHDVLKALALGEATLGSIARSTHQDMATLSESISYLAEEGLVYRDQDYYLGCENQQSTVSLTIRGESRVQH